MRALLFFALAACSLSALAQLQIEVGTRVISNDGNNRIGTVTEVRYNGTARVQFDRRRTRIVPLDTLSDAVLCSHGICAGGRVIHARAHRDTGTVVEIFRNGLAKVDWDRSRRDGNPVSAYYLQPLGPRQAEGNCRYGYCD